MSCDAANSLLHGYVDGELDSVRAREFEGHLRSCAECANELLDLDLLSLLGLSRANFNGVVGNVQLVKD